ncbi:MAG: hypothetical protein LBT46_14685 [Planctomycetaceae bacterium]|nr:hypothetical protein [Planctomycetaceae bacterium]
MRIVKISLVIFVLCIVHSAAYCRDAAGIGTLRDHSEPVRVYLEACDQLAWNTLPFAQPVVLPVLPDTDASLDKTAQFSLREYLAMRLIQGRFYEEAEKVLNTLNEQDAPDPAALLIMKAVVAHQFANTEAAASALEQFRRIAQPDSPQNTPIPRRYIEIAKLLRYETEQKSGETEQIAKQMNGVRRKLGKGKTGDDTQKSEDGILKSLDKLIEKTEQQVQKQASGEPKGGEGNSPAKDSYRMGQKAPGKVDRRDFSPDADWGSLPPKERDEALLKIEKDFPPFYRDIIEQYFRELAK